ncbi:hypothetical protein PLICRDRAFT_700453 [Plicaturopsis crispa FD-325 SS-3]|nr:hypothetical protein PLICRDRAFT_700453 [Plicaturopsis crispa FD-325 SS-3]
MPIGLTPVPLPPSADPEKLSDFGRIVTGVDLSGAIAPSDFQELEDALYKYSLLVFRDVDLSPEQQYELTKAFDPTCEDAEHGHGNKRLGKDSILHYLRGLPAVPQVQLLGSGSIHAHANIPEITLEHPSHRTSHKTHISPEDEAGGVTRFNRWHMDAALYDLPVPRVTTLYGIRVPEGPPQTCKYDDGTGDELPLPLGSTAFVSGKTMFDAVPEELKSVAVRARVRYAPRPYEWMAPARLLSTGLGVEVEGLEVPYERLREWEEGKRKVYPVLWKNPVTGGLHFMVHPCCAAELLVDPLPQGTRAEGALYPDGAHLTDLGEVRELLYRMQRPGIAPQLVYPHDWRPNDLVIFHNRGVMHTVTGAFKEGQVRVFHQCNLVASDEPVGPSPEDVRAWV